MLSISKATQQARRHVNLFMPGVLATVESRLSHDLTTDTPLVITTITFPAGHPMVSTLATAAHSLVGFRSMVGADSSLVITRSR